ncbi:acyl-CoA dehydrogenase [Polyangium jinanense]|uniref:acyl-CoA dehydrogenase n=1 Tax=Polyangium jinanense TaxID=2829994 RepID=UPI002340E733|nr:acyl-CoA dehydrogenase [Polyangium jinanense]MDC3959579.1 acyl-CoA dehydrogenase [Polyangium jinanense]
MPATSTSTNPLVSDRFVDFLLFEVLDLEGLLALPDFAEHTRETVGIYLGTARRLARELLFPAYKPMDEAPPRLENGHVRVHRAMHDIYPRLVELGVLSATRPPEAHGQMLPLTVASLATSYLMAANLSAYGYIGLTTGAARLLESFGSDELKERFMGPLYRGEWTGTMALTEPQAGSSLSDVETRATPTERGHYLLKGSKIFISGGDHDLTENIVHLTLARIDGAPPGIKGVSLFAIPKLRPERGALVPNDVEVAGVIHKIGWRGLPSLALNFGEAGDCHGYLVGEPHRGISYMFQMMNEARLMVGMNGAATASVAFHESLEYAKTRPQGRKLGDKDPRAPQIPIIEHADVRRMLLRQKAIAWGSLALLGLTARLSDLAEHAQDESSRARAAMLLDLLTPIAKSFPAERGFEANALAVQVLGGYGYTSEYLPEAWLRDQKLNSIHEGTTGIQSLDLLGRKVPAAGGAAFGALLEEIAATCDGARDAAVNPDLVQRVEGAAMAMRQVTLHLGALGAQGDVRGMLLHSADYLDLASTMVIGWTWLRLAATAQKNRADRPQDHDFYEGIASAAQYWIRTELPRVGYLAQLCRSGEDSYERVRPEWF